MKQSLPPNKIAGHGTESSLSPSIVVVLCTAEEKQCGAEAERPGPSSSLRDKCFSSMELLSECAKPVKREIYGARILLSASPLVSFRAATPTKKAPDFRQTRSLVTVVYVGKI
ncbi:hypothetical protein MTO96_040363 [Rhipicephalus appendiculatus]